MPRPSIEQLLQIFLRRPPRTALTAAETDLVARLARGLSSVVEVGVYQGATSVRLASAMAAGGRLWLVDPFTLETRPERLLGVSFNQWLARRAVRRFGDRVCFLRQPSPAAAAAIPLIRAAEMIFVDADHSYEAVRADFHAWAARLAHGGVVAFHDSRVCTARPDLDLSAGPVRLVEEIRAGAHGQGWAIVAVADSITAFSRA